jgi:hypothetical protein
VFAVLIAVAAGFAYLAAVRQNKTSRELTDHYQMVQEAGGKLAAAFSTAQASVLSSAFSSGDARRLRKGRRWPVMPVVLCLPE